MYHFALNLIKARAIINELNRFAGSYKKKKKCTRKMIHQIDILNSRE